MKNFFDILAPVILKSIQNSEPQWEMNPWTPDRVRGDDRAVILNLIQDPGHQWTEKVWIPDQARNNNHPAYICHPELDSGSRGMTARKDHFHFVGSSG